MFGLPNSAELMQLASLLAPGIIVLAIRASVREGPRPELKDRVIAYAAVSAAYYAFAYPIFHWRGGLLLTPELWGLLQYFLAPSAIGLLAAYEHQGQWIRRTAKAVGLYLHHPIPTAWDYAFYEIEEGTFLLVTLTNESQVAGLMGAKSFASSSREERDLLLEEVWKIQDDGEWVKSEPRRSILLCGRDIRHVEIFVEDEELNE